MAQAKQVNGKSKGIKNPDRRNGKAWKKPKAAKKKTEARQLKDRVIQMEREARRVEGMARHEIEMAAKAEINEHVKEASRNGVTA